MPQSKRFIFDLDSSVLIDLFSLRLANGHSGIYYLQEIAEMLMGRGFEVQFDLSELVLKEITSHQLSVPKSGQLQKLRETQSSQHGPRLNELLSLTYPDDSPLFTACYRHPKAHISNNHNGMPKADSSIIHHTLTTASEGPNPTRIVFTRDRALIETLGIVSSGGYSRLASTMHSGNHYGQARTFMDYAERILHDEQLWGARTPFFVSNTGALLSGMEILQQQCGQCFTPLINQRNSIETVPFSKKLAKQHMRDYDLRKIEGIDKDKEIRTTEDISLSDIAKRSVNKAWQNLTRSNVDIYQR